MANCAANPLDSHCSCSSSARLHDFDRGDYYCCDSYGYNGYAFDSRCSSFRPEYVELASRLLIDSSSALRLTYRNPNVGSHWIQARVRVAENYTLDSVLKGLSVACTLDKLVDGVWKFQASSSSYEEAYYRTPVAHHDWLRRSTYTNSGLIWTMIALLLGLLLLGTYGLVSVGRQLY